jgi:hypothetical protein
MTADEGQPLRTVQPSSWQLGWKMRLDRWSVMWIGWKKMLGAWGVKWLDWIKMLINRGAKSFNWNAIRNNRTMLYIAVALIVILISVPVILWRTGGTPEKDPGTVPSPTAAATPGVTKKAKTSPMTNKKETTAVAKKAESPAVAKKVKPPGLEQKAEIPAPTPEDQKKTDTATTPEDQKKPDTATTPEKPSAPATVSLGIAPWGEVYVDGNKKGVSPPLNSLQVTPGKHQIEIRNTTFPSYKQDVDLKPGGQLKIKHKFR